MFLQLIQQDIKRHYQGLEEKFYIHALIRLFQIDTLITIHLLILQDQMSLDADTIMAQECFSRTF